MAMHCIPPGLLSLRVTCGNHVWYMAGRQLSVQAPLRIGTLAVYFRLDGMHVPLNAHLSIDIAI
jgi:hypothetical protein